MDFPTLDLVTARRMSLRFDLALAFGWSYEPDSDVPVCIGVAAEERTGVSRSELERLLRTSSSVVGFQLWSTREDGADIFVSVDETGTSIFFDGLRGDTLMSGIAFGFAQAVAWALSGELRFASLELGAEGAHPAVWRSGRVDWTDTEPMPDLMVLPAVDLPAGGLPSELTRLELGPYVALANDHLARHLLWRRDR